ncbi:hypothetical protein XMM379_001243 [Aliiroseovarius sp. xm-m-379]|nr:hypothetical protein [Aliiroseovarius sp. xm-d-517]NRP24559.1 hypothetical protein [Aliiroseovarius sp. xm-m-379]NRP29631.1 hypothetical protein [Aliiroseovarius sp. xm-m-314]NRP33358.1 hypothetical protein [Aliiroseovarius sp. xm-a-104]NRP39641.1 hypothetical protein [Aliiroseovarius sp. xm-m-339-2]NRP45940.1 hypothetical protein [Aliiroseovarius sp. xm-m-378]NRP49196.1 hypothetical protein [Aliiroseovarius sp. xm-m-354]NRP60647.1 hypothetical protein [Aliiroseovarius sp. xm-a-151]NRP66
MTFPMQQLYYRSPPSQRKLSPAYPLPEPQTDRKSPVNRRDSHKSTRDSPHALALHHPATSEFREKPRPFRIRMPINTAALPRKPRESSSSEHDTVIEGMSRDVWERRRTLTRGRPLNPTSSPAHFPFPPSGRHGISDVLPEQPYAKAERPLAVNLKRMRQGSTQLSTDQTRSSLRPVRRNMQQSGA